MLPVLLVLPFLSASFLGETRELPRWIVLQLAAFAMLAIEVWRGRSGPSRAWLVSVLIFGAVVLMASALADSPLRSIFGPYEGHVGMLAWWTCLALAAASPPLARLPLFTGGLVAIGIIETIVLAFQRAGDAPPIGTLGHVLFFAGFLELAIIAAAGWALDAEHKGIRAGLIAATFAMCAALTIAGRRSALISLAIGLLALAVLAKRRRRLLTVVISGALGVVLFSGFVPNPLQPYRPLERFEERARVTQRIDDYRVALEAVPAHPVLGYGFGTFGDLYAAHKANERMAEETSVHSVWLEILLAAGGLGVVAFVLVCLATLRAARARIRAAADGPLGGRVAACGALAIAHLVFLSVNFEQAALAGWAFGLCGFLVGGEEPSMGARFRAPAAVVLGLLGLVGAERALADYAFAECMSRGLIGQRAEVEAMCALALRVSPYESAYRSAIERLPPVGWAP